jgi:hypothetical protein
MATNWMPIVGRGCRPGLVGSTSSIDFSVVWPNAAEAFLYSGISYVLARLPAGTRDQPSFWPASFS